jgi:septal ring factor EnvC (AmiA/AmiB activator)
VSAAPYLDKLRGIAYKPPGPFADSGAARRTSVTRHAGSGRWVSVAAFLALVPLGLARHSRAAAAPPPKADARAKAAGSPVPRQETLEQLRQTLDQIVEAQRSLAGSLSELGDEITELQRGVGELREELRNHQDAAQGAWDQIKGMREEIRGLYVESSGVKSDVGQVGKQVETLDEHLGGFRLSSGVVVAVVIVLQVVVAGLLLRGRG